MPSGEIASRESAGGGEGIQDAGTVGREMLGSALTKKRTRGFRRHHPLCRIVGVCIYHLLRVGGEATMYLLSPLSSE